MEIEYSSHFKRVYIKLGADIQEKAEDKEKIFSNNPLDPRLKTHRLHGKLKEFFSFSIDYKYRIVFKFLDQNKALFLDIGDHDVYQ